MNRKILFFGFLGIFCVSLFVFFPSFFHVSRADHNVYLIETAEMESLSDLVVFSYSYPRTRQINTGDALFFRPVFYFFLALEKWLFGFNPLGWQVTGFVLHMIVIWQILRIATLVHASFLSLPLALGFAVLFISQEMVIWHHVNGYILCVVFLLQAFYYFAQYVLSSQTQSSLMKKMVVLLSLGCLTFEFSVACCLIFMFFLFVHSIGKYKTDDNTFLHGRIEDVSRSKMKGELSCRKIGCVQKSGGNTSSRGWHNIGVLVIPIVVYACMSLGDYLARVGMPSLPGGGAADISGVVKDFFLVFLTLGAAVLMPYFCRFLPAARTEFKHLMVNDIAREFGHYNGWEFFNVLYILLFAGWLICVFRLCVKRRELFRKDCGPEDKNITAKHIGILAATSLSMSGAYCFMITVGRLQGKTFGYIVNSLYHFYIIALFLVIGLYCLGYLFFLYFGKERGMRGLRWGLWVLLLMSVCLNAYQSYTFNMKAKHHWKRQRAQVQRFSAFVREHKHEKDFSFKILLNEFDESIEYYLGDPKTQPVMIGSYTNLIFRRYIKDSPKYFLVYLEREGIKDFLSKKEAADYLNTLVE